MDEAIKIYSPVSHHDNKIHYEKPFVEPEEKKVKRMKKLSKHAAQKESKWKFWFDLNTLKEVVREQSKRTNELAQKYSIHVIGYRWFAALAVIALFVSFGIWGINIHTEQKMAVAYAEATAVKEAEHQAFVAQQEADKEAEQAAIETIMKMNAQTKAKAAWGSRNFVEVYHYGDDDFMTLFQCFDNRMNNPMYEGMTIEEIAFQDGQFIASYATNPVEDYYYNLAMKSERMKLNRDSQPVGSDYVYAVYTPHGIYLTNDPKSPEYTWWHYSE